MRVLRENSDTLLALFEEFISDPLINDKIINPQEVSLDSNIQRESILVPTRELFTESVTENKNLQSQFENTESKENLVQMIKELKQNDVDIL